MKLKLQNISMSFSDKKILSQITMNIEEGRICHDPGSQRLQAKAPF